MLPDALDPGDAIEFGLTVEHKTRGASIWPKVGVTSSVREGETAEEALSRIEEFVTSEVQKVIKETS